MVDLEVGLLLAVSVLYFLKGLGKMTGRMRAMLKINININNTLWTPQCGGTLCGVQVNQMLLR